MHTLSVILYKDSIHLYTITNIMYTMTTIRVSKETSRKIIELKQKHSFKNADETILYLIKLNEKYENSKVVRVIEDAK